MLNPKQCVLYSGGAAGTEQFFGALAEGWGIEEVNYSFEGHQIERKRGVRVLTSEELALKDVSLTYVSKLMNREYTRAPIFRKVLQSICWQVSSGNQVIVIGAIQPDNTVKGGTGWGAEFAKICNKPLLVFDQPKNGWFTWDKEVWTPVEKPVIEHAHFAAHGHPLPGRQRPRRHPGPLRPLLQPLSREQPRLPGLFGRIRRAFTGAAFCVL